MAWGIGGAQLDPQIEEGEPLSFSAWVEVDLSALEHNLRLLQSRSQAPILPILKGDAYGHGAPVVASFLHSRGCSAVGVSTVEEALDILSWTKVGIMLLTPPLPSQFPAVVRHGLTPAVTCPGTGAFPEPSRKAQAENHPGADQGGHGPRPPRGRPARLQRFGGADQKSLPSSSGRRFHSLRRCGLRPPLHPTAARMPAQPY